MGLTAKHIMNNAELLKAMDTVVRYLNDEGGIEPWLRCGLPDGWNKDDLMDMAQDEDMMDWACVAFRHSMHYAEAGWFTQPFEVVRDGGTVSKPYGTIE